MRRSECRAGTCAGGGAPSFAMKTEEETFGQPFRRDRETRAEQRPAPNRSFNFQFVSPCATIRSRLRQGWNETLI